MTFGLIPSTLSIAFAAFYKALNDHLVSNFTNFVRGFEVAIFAVAAIIFLLMAVVILLRRARRLPVAYEVKVLDLDGNHVRVDGFRNIFSTYDAAESYARFYSANYVGQYRFKVIGLSKHQVAAVTL